MAQGPENGRPNVLSHLIQRRSRRARPTRRPQSHQAPRWTRKCTGFDHQYAAHPPPSRGGHEDCSVRACCMTMAHSTCRLDPIKNWTGTAITQPFLRARCGASNRPPPRRGQFKRPPRRMPPSSCSRATQPVATDGGGELTTASTAAARSGGPRTGEASRRAGRRVF